MSRRVIRYVPTKPDDGPVRQRLRELEAERRRFGYSRLGCLLARQGMSPNHKKLLRIYREDVPHLPLHHQIRPWAMRKNVDTVHRADDRPMPIWTIKILSSVGRRRRVLAGAAAGLFSDITFITTHLC